MQAGKNTVFQLVRNEVFPAVEVPSAGHRRWRPSASGSKLCAARVLGRRETKRQSMKLSRTVLLITGAAALAGAAGYGLRAWAEGTPKDQPLLYRGTLLNPDGTPLAGSHQIVVSLFAQETMGDPLCASAASSVDLTATRGQFRVPLAAGAGAATPDCAQIVHQYSDLWVGVS